MMAESTLTKHEAFADGLQAENIPPIAIEGHKLGLFVQLLPTYIVEGTRPHISLTVRLFESEVNENIPNVKYAITIGRFDLAAKEGIRPLVSDMFYSEPGPLILNISSIIEGVHVDAPKTYNSEAWIVDLETGAIDYGTSAVFEGGLYYIGVKIAGIGGPDQTFGENAPLFEAGLSIGYASNNDVRYQDESHSIGIISYYDKIRDFSFEESTLTFSWSMPFDWDVRRIENKDMIVHQEIKIPRTLYDISNSFSFEGTVNGIELPKNSIALDPFSFEDYMTIHYIITKQQILAISKSLHTGTSEMHLTLSAGDKNILEHPEEGKTLLLTDNGGILITIDWMPKHLEASVESKMQIRFFDTYSEQPLDKDILYDLSVLDLRGDQVISRIELIAKNGTDVQPVTFQNNDAYHVEINVKGFLLTEQNGTQQSTTLDVSRSGVARSIVNVPEFLSPLLLMASSALLVLILTSRILSRNKINGACNRSL
jgi:hypothetical protein